MHEAIRRGSWVIDLRPRHDFARAHLTGSINIEDGPRSRSTPRGWRRGAATSCCVSDSADDLAAGVHDLAQIGVRCGPRTCSARRHLVRLPRLPRRRLGDVLRSPRGSVTLDVRLDSEYRDAHLPESFHIPLHDLEGAACRLPAGQVWVHCKSGFRAAIAASLLARAVVTSCWSPTTGKARVHRLAGRGRSQAA